MFPNVPLVTNKDRSSIILKCQRGHEKMFSNALLFANRGGILVLRVPTLVTVVDLVLAGNRRQ